jgi:hypothetical protein
VHSLPITAEQREPYTLRHTYPSELVATPPVSLARGSCCVVAACSARTPLDSSSALVILFIPKHNPVFQNII